MFSIFGKGLELTSFVASFADKRCFVNHNVNILSGAISSQRGDFCARMETVPCMKDATFGLSFEPLCILWLTFQGIIGVHFSAKQLNPLWTRGEVPGTRYGLSDKGWTDQVLFKGWLKDHFHACCSGTPSSVIDRWPQFAFVPATLRYAAEHVLFTTSYYA